MSLNKEQTELLSKYKSLSYYHQFLLEFLSVYNDRKTVYDIHIVFKLEPFASMKFFKDKQKNTLKALSQDFLSIAKSRLILPFGRDVFECNSQISELIVREAAKKEWYKELYFIIKKHQLNANTFHGSTDFSNLLRMAMYYDNGIFLEEQFHEKMDSDPKNIQVSVLNRILSNYLHPMDLSLLKKIPVNSWFFTLVYHAILDNTINSNPYNIEDYKEGILILLDIVKDPKNTVDPKIISLLLEFLLFQGKYKEKDEILNRYLSFDEVVLNTQIVESFIKGELKNCISQFEKMAVIHKANTKKKNFIPESCISIFYLLSLICFGQEDNYKKATEFCLKITRSKLHIFLSIFENFRIFLEYITAVRPQINLQFFNSSNLNSFWDTIVTCLIVLWLGGDLSKENRKQLNLSRERNKKIGFLWIELQILVILEKFSSDTTNKKSSDAGKSKNFYITDIYQKQEKWKTLLNALSAIAPKTDAPKKEHKEGTIRLAWMFRKMPIYGNATIEAIEQTYSETQKKWLQGKFVSIHALKTETKYSKYFTEQDKRILDSFIKQPYSSDYKNSPQIFKNLAGHPYLYLETKQNHIQLESGSPELRVLELDSDRLKIVLHPFKTINDTNFMIISESPQKFKYIEFTQEHDKMISILGEKGLNVPKKGKDDVLRALSALSGVVTIQSDIGGSDVAGAEVIEPSAVPHIQIYPNGLGLKILVMFRPFGEQGPYYKPSSGGKVLFTEIDSKKLQTTRNFTEENKRLELIINSCPTLVSSQKDNLQEWIIEEPQQCLQTLLEFHSLEDQAILEWPDGEKYKIKKFVNTSNFKMKIQRDNDWFSVSGELDLDNSEVLQMQTLMELLDQSPGRFVKLKDGSFLALTNEFRKQLDDLNAISEHTKKGYRVSSLTAPLLEEMTDQVAELKADIEWNNHLQKLKDLKDFQPTLPSTFQATLREYQKDGFEWLSRLSKWGVGACLADDMGLGKTIQALTVILEHAPNGPSLVIAPTSVCMNWHTEVSKYAPTLNSIQFGNGNREEMINNLQPFDLLVCTYGLIQQAEVADILKKIRWKVIVLDEAQAIKNMTTKRSQAVMSLDADFKLITTGTPIENHLGELWNLFRFLNPGLLGSLETFNQRFAIPIEKNKDKDSRNRLKRLIQPFILRRMKSDVLTELPEKTDITLQVELSEKEKAFYEALRLNAIKKLSSTDLKDGQKHLQILAEIMKLRRACCNAQLVEKKIAIPSSKLAAFIEVLEELLENKHKALVFSQFVDHLSIIKKQLDSMKVSYQYLDGSTPMKERTKRVNAFQAGEGDVFLISLKAGGSGLNLTAADYVIHLDPWWNPAVEDQASDRAHRIGQKRPVTVYRIVAKDTIEEKIIDLHKHKRDLADSLLDETDMSGKISADELLSLLKGN